jgi:hypothetical protein
MTTSNDFPVYNGISPSYADLSAQAFGLDLDLLEIGDIKSINTNITVEVGEKKIGGRVIDTTTGEVSYEFGMTLYQAGWLSYVERLAQAAESLGHVRGNYKRVSLVHHDLVYRFEVPGVAQLFEVTIKGIRYLGRNMQTAQGNDSLEVECKFHCKEIIDDLNGTQVVLL